MKLPKKYIKKYGLTKKAWAEFKKARKKVGRKIKRVVKKVTKKRKVLKKGHNPTYKKGVRKVAKKRKTASKYPRRRRATLLTNRTMNAVVNGGIIGGTAIGSTWIVNMIPMIKDQASWVKALAQAGIGVMGLTFSRDLMVKKAFSGFIAGGAITLILPFMPETFKFGAGRALTTPELRELQMGSRYNSLANKTGKPVSVGKPVSITMGRGTRGYTRTF